MWPFKNKLDLNKEVTRIHTIISGKIHSNRVARQFILEELEAASNGNDKAKMFASQSGFNKNEYAGAMGNSFNEVDGAGGPQQTLLAECMSLKDMNVIVEVRTRVTQKIIEQYRNNYFIETSSEQKIINQLMELNSVRNREEAATTVKTLSTINSPELSHEKFVDILINEINTGKNFLHIIRGNDFKGSRNLIFFMKDDKVQKLLQKISETSVVGILFKQEETWSTIKLLLDEVTPPMFAMVTDSVANDLYRVVLAMSAEKTAKPYKKIIFDIQNDFRMPQIKSLKEYK